jgi:hypothetical protein
MVNSNASLTEIPFPPVLAPLPFPQSPVPLLHAMPAPHNGRGTGSFSVSPARDLNLL